MMAFLQRAAISAMLGLLLSSCAGSGHSPLAPLPDTGQPPVPQQELVSLPGSDHQVLLPAFPPSGPLSNWRQLSAAERQIDGTETSTSGGSNNYNAGNGVLAVVPGSKDELAWAVYRLGQVNTARPTQLQLEVNSIIPGSNDDLAYWVLVGDYSTMRWNVNGPFGGPESVTLNSQSERGRYASKQDGATEPVFTFAVITMGIDGNNTQDPPQEQPRVEIASSTTTVEDVSSSSYQATNPHFARITGAGSGGSSMRRSASNATLELQFEHISDPVAGGKCEAALYQFARKGPGDTVVTGSDINNLIIGSVGQPITGSYLDPADNMNGVSPPQPGETYRYYMRGRNATGQFSGWAIFDSLITAPMPAVQNLTASMNLSTHVQLEWESVPGVKGYRIMRSEYENPQLEYLTGTLPQGQVSYSDDSAVTDLLYDYWVIPVGEGETLDDADDLDTPEEGAPLSLPAMGIRKATLLPIAFIDADISAGELPLLVNFDGSGSFDPDGGPILLYEWDFDGDGSYDDGGPGPLTSHAYTSAGVFTAVLRVTDDEGESATDSMLITVYDWYGPDMIDSGTDVGSYSALAMVNGLPAVSYVGPDGTSLQYAVNSLPDGSGSWSSVEVDTLEVQFSWVSLAEIDGRPAISYLRDGDLRYAICDNANGSGSWTLVEIAAGPFFDTGTSLCALASGNPAISAFNSSFGAQVYAHSATASGADSLDWSLQTPDADIGAGAYSSLRLVAGNPAISYLDSFSAQLRYTWSATADGANVTDWTVVVVDDSGELGEYSSLAVVAGCPAISYHDSTNGLLKFAYAASSTGASALDWSLLMLDGGGVGQHTSLAVVDGRPAVSYFNYTDGTLDFAWSLTADGRMSGDWDLWTLDIGDVGMGTSLAALGSGLPGISYSGGNALLFMHYR